MNFGGFAGGFADGFERGQRIGKNIRDMLKEKKREEMLKTAREEAGAAYDAQSVASGGLPDTSAKVEPVATSGPVDGAVPTAETPPVVPAAAAAPAGNPYDPGDTRTDPPPAAAAPAQPAPSVATQSPGAATPAPAVVQPTGPAPQAAAPAMPSPAAPTPQAVAAAGVPGAAPAKPMPAAPAARQPADPAARSAFIQKEMGKRAYDYFVGEGDIETAEKWLKHSETAAARTAMKDWAKAYTAPDFDTAIKGFGKYYSDHVNDGVNYKGHEIITKADGSQVGVVTLKDKATGKESKMELTRDSMLRMAEANNPAALYKAESERAAAASKATIEAREKANERTYKRDETVYKEDRADARAKITADNQAAQTRLKAELDAANLGAKERAGVEAKISILKESGYTDEQIKGLMPALVGAGEHKKTTSPTERRALVVSDLTKNDPTFARLPEAEQSKRVDQAMRIIGTDPESKPGAASPGAAAPGAPGAPVYVRDKQTGDVFKMEDGKRVLVRKGSAAAPPAPPAAAGVPPRTGGASGGF